jgi:hypothetical protein
MAWTVPVAWVDGTIVTATFLDAQIKGNMDFLGTSHRHSTGTAGEGGGSLGPLSYMDFAIGTVVAQPAATALRLFASGTRFMAHIGTTSTIAFSPTGHEHTIATNAIVSSNPTSTSHSGGAAIQMFGRSLPVNTQTATVSTALTVGGSGARGLAISAGYWVGNSDTASATATLRLFRESTAIASATLNNIFPGGGTAAASKPAIVSLNHFVAAATAGSVTYKMTIDVTGGGGFAAGEADAYAPHFAIFEIKEA